MSDVLKDEESTATILRPQRKKKASLTAQGFLFVCAVVFVIFLVAGSSFWQTLVSDRLPYFSEQQLKKNLEIESRLRVFLRDRNGATQSNIETMKFTPESMFLPRWPIGDEVFVGSADRELVIGRYDDETLWVRPMGDLNSFWKREDGFAYLITTGGINLGSSRPERMSAKTGMKRKEIDEFFRSGIASGARIYRDKLEGDRIVAHREVAATNVVLFTETQLGELRTEHLGALKSLALWLVSGALIAVLVGIYLIRVVSRPLRAVLQQTDVTKDNTPKRHRRFDFHDEFYIMSNILVMIRQRIQEIVLFQRDESKIRALYRQYLKSLRSSFGTQDALGALSDVLSKWPRTEVRQSTVQYLIFESQLVNGKTVKKVVNKYVLLEKGQRPAPKQGGNGTLPHQESDDGDQSISALEFIESSSDRFEINISSSNTQHKVLLLNGKDVGLIANSERRWLILFARLLGRFVDL